MKHRSDFRAILRTLVLVPLLTAGLAAVSVRSADAATYTCTTTVNGGTIKSSVIVPPGEVCYLYGVVVTGGVTVRAGGAVDVYYGSDVRGAISASSANWVGVFESTVRGAISLSNVGYVYIGSSKISGNTALSSTLLDFDLENNTFDSSVVLSDNVQDGQFSNAFEYNTVKLNVVCDDNTGLFYEGNTVGGSESDECFESGD